MNFNTLEHGNSSNMFNNTIEKITNPEQKNLSQNNVSFVQTKHDVVNYKQNKTKHVMSCLK